MPRLKHGAPKIYDSADKISFNMYKTDIEWANRERGQKTLGVFLRDFMHTVIELYKEINQDVNQPDR